MLDLQDAISLFEEGEPRQAADLLEKLAAEMPGYATARVLLARSYEQLNEWDAALRAWREAHQIIPNSPVIRRGLQRAARKAGSRSPIPPPAEAPAWSGVPDDEPAAPPAESEDEGYGYSEEPELSAPPEVRRAAEPKYQDRHGAERQADHGAEGHPTDPGAEGHPTDPGAEGHPADPGAEGHPADPGAEGHPADPGAEEQPTDPGAEGQPADPGAEGHPNDLDAEGQAADFDAEGQPTKLAPEAQPQEPRGEGQAEELGREGRSAAPDTPAATPDAPAAEADNEARTQGVEEYEDLDRLISELESARIVPRPDLENVPPPDLEDDIEDVVSETLARIYASQGQYEEAAHVYELLADQQPEKADEFNNKASEMRSRASGKE